MVRYLSDDGFGQLCFAAGAAFSKGGRAITVLPSTGKNGAISRVVGMLEQGTVVNIPRSLADYIVTEYGIAHLKGKSLRKRAEQMISIAHPDFRDELRAEAKRLYWP